MFRRPRQAGRIYPPHSAYALRVQLVCPIKDESSRRTDRPQPNTHQQEQQHFYPRGSNSNPKGIIQENNILYNSGNPNYSCRRKQDGTYKIQRPFVFVTKDGAELSEAAQAFIDFATSDAASELIVNAGAVPVAK